MEENNMLIVLDGLWNADTLASIYRYLDSEEFMPVQEIELEVLETLVR